MNTYEEKNDLRCPVCLQEWNEKIMAKAKITACPRCSTTIPPMRIRDDGYVKVNWQDMRVLVIYAQRWAQLFDTSKKGNRDALEALKNITKKVEESKPKEGQELSPKEAPIIGKMSTNTPQVQTKEITPMEALKKIRDKGGNIESPYFRKAPE